MQIAPYQPSEQPSATGGVFNRNFYPTPVSVIEHMLQRITAERLRSSQILEPSAGKGDILDYITYDRVSELRSLRDINRRMTEEENEELDRVLEMRCGVHPKNVYAIEISPDLAAALIGKGYKVIGSDFLTWYEKLHIDLVIMNPPFDAGADHLLKAWEVVAAGGEVLCLLNAETVNNPYSTTRLQLAKVIRDHGEVEQLGAAFADAERKTDVDVVLVHLKKPARDRFSFEGLSEEERAANAPDFNSNLPVSANNIEALVTSYNLAVEALQQRWMAEDAYHYYLGGITDWDNDPIQRVKKRKPFNEQIADLKRLFWKNVFDRTKIGQRTTSSFREDFEATVATQSNVAFTVENIMSVLHRFIGDLGDIMQKCIVDTFDKGTRYHEKNATRYLVDGWKTNKAYKLNYKMILPHGIGHDWQGHFELGYRDSSRDFYDDLDRCCCFLLGRKFEETHGISKAIEGKKWLEGNGFKLDSEFFIIQLYKKGTVHLTWKDQTLLDAFNLAAAKGKNWIGDGE